MFLSRASPAEDDVVAGWWLGGGGEISTRLTNSRQLSVSHEHHCSRGSLERCSAHTEIPGSSITNGFTALSRLDVDLQGRTNYSTYMFMLETPHGFDICPIDSAAIV